MTAMHEASLRLKGKRIVFCFGSLELGGAERQGFLLAEYLKDTVGAHVEMWGFHGPGHLSALCDAKSIPWRVVPFPLSQRGMAAAREIWRFSVLLRQAGVDVLLPYTTMPNIVCALGAVLGGVRVCAWNQRDEGLERFTPWVESLALRIAGPIVANSTSSARFLTETKGLPAHHVHIVPNGVALAAPVSLLESWRQHLGAGKGDLLVAMIANISPFKDHETLLRAWKRVLDDFNGEASLLLAGNHANESKTSEVRTLIAALGLQNSVRLLDRVDDIPGFLEAIDLVVHSSRSEGLPNAVIEAMVAGKAVIGTDIPGVRDALGEHGDYVAVGDEAAMAHGILRYLNDDALRRAAGARNRADAAERFGIRRMCEHMTALITRTMK